MNRFLFSILILFFFHFYSLNSFSQNDIRFYSGLGTSEDVKYSLGVDYSFNLLEKSSKFNLGSNLGIHYNRFNDNLLNTNEQIYFQLGLQVNYRFLEKMILRVDLGNRIPFSNENYFLIDSNGNPILNSTLESYNFLNPSLEYKVNKTISCFAFYTFAFEDAIDLNSVGIGFIINLN